MTEFFCILGAVVFFGAIIAGVFWCINKLADWSFELSEMKHDIERHGEKFYEIEKRINRLESPATKGKTKK